MSEGLVLEKKAILCSEETQAKNFFHLYFDVVWYGLTFGSTLSFLPVFSTRLGATGWQVGLLTAGPALVNLIFTMLATRWIEKRSLGKAATQTAFWQRLGLLLFIPLPLFLPDWLKIWAVLILVLVMAIPGTALMISFNALLASTVPKEERGRVVGIRNALVAATIMLSFWGSGWILDQLSFEWGYLTIFTVGAVGAMMSTWHISRIQVPAVPRKFEGHSLGDHAQPGRVIGDGSGLRLRVGSRLLLNWKPDFFQMFAGISARYWWVMTAFFIFHFGQMLATPLMPLFWVKEVHLSDGQIGWLNAVMFLSMFLSSFALAPLTKRFGNLRLVVWTIVLQVFYPLLTAISADISLLLVAAVIGGGSWGVLGGASINRMLEHVPDDDRPPYLALYNVAFNTAIFTSAMAGPFVADIIGIREALLVVAALRAGSSLALHRWG